MILGIGTDLLRISRMEKALQRHGQRLPERILHPEEMSRYISSKNPANFLAKSFAVKEAAVKALGLGFRGIGYADIGWAQNELGKPTLCYSKHGLRIMQEKGASGGFVSLTDEGDMVVAVVVLEKLESTGADVLSGDSSSSPF